MSSSAPPGFNYHVPVFLEGTESIIPFNLRSVENKAMDGCIYEMLFPVVLQADICPPWALSLTLRLPAPDTNNLPIDITQHHFFVLAAAAFNNSAAA